MITHTKLLELMRYDLDTGYFWWIKGRKGTKPGVPAGTTRPDGYCTITINGNRYLNHRLAWFYVYGGWPELDVDHKDGNPSNNRISNLRQATRSQNTANSKRRVNNTSGYKGVYFSKKINRWVARVKKDYRYYHIGVFDVVEDAHNAYLKAAEEFHGEFMRSK